MDAAGVPTDKKYTGGHMVVWCGVVWCGVVWCGVVLRVVETVEWYAAALPQHPQWWGTGAEGHTACAKQHGHWRYTTHRNMNNRNDQDWHRDHSRWDAEVGTVLDTS